MSRLLDTKRGQRRQKYEFCVAPPPCRNRARYRRPSGAAGANWLAEAGRGLGQPAARCGAEGGLRRASLGRSPSQRVFGLGALTRCRCMVPGPAPTRCPSQPYPQAGALRACAVHRARGPGPSLHRGRQADGGGQGAGGGGESPGSRRCLTLVTWLEAMPNPTPPPPTPTPLPLPLTLPLTRCLRRCATPASLSR